MLFQIVNVWKVNCLIFSVCYFGSVKNDVCKTLFDKEMDDGDNFFEIMSMSDNLVLACSF